MSEPTYRLTLRPLPDSGIPPVQRLRHGLKLLLRVCRLRCVEAVELDAEGRPVEGPSADRPQGEG